MKLVHAADLHIDSPLRGLSRYEGAPVEQLRGATRRALENLVNLCLEEDARLLLIAGDVFDGGWRDYSTGLYFTAQMARLRKADVQVVMLRGNHDAASQITKELRLPENVRELSTRRPETVVFEALGVAVHGQGFASQKVLEDLASRYPAATASLFNIGLLHSSLGGRPGHEPYAPSTLEVLRSKGYDYWALGHVHAREVVSDDPWVVFPGNLQGRHARELGPKGASVLTVDNGRLTELRHHALDVVRWALCEVDVSVASDGHDVVDLAREALAGALAQASGRMLAVRVVLRGQTRAHAALVREPERWTAELEAAALDVGDGAIWIEQVQLKTRGALDPAVLSARQDAIGELVRSLTQLEHDDTELQALSAGFAELGRKLPAAIAEGDDALALAEPAFIASLLPDVRELLLSRLLEGEDADADGSSN